jgi:3'-phosphoadenosine 5'-phosphosulfate sulfotransferase (PAPS reductase)/FAD synthetase
MITTYNMCDLLPADPLPLVTIGRAPSRAAGGRTDAGVVTTDAIDTALARNAAVAIGVSGGKDSCALAFATVEYLDRIGHTGPRVLIHADLGRVEWDDSLPTCERLAARLGLELIVVRRGAGDMMDRWLTRWSNNMERYAALSCVKAILPWSTPSMRFCTSELKTAPICAALVKRFPGRQIVSACGIRRAESNSKTSGRGIAPVAKEQAKLASKKHRTTGLDWHPIIEWEHADVYASLEARSFALHEAYTKHGMSRVSCRFCIMSNASDRRAAAAAAESADLYREMVDLEIRSTFAFQGSTWLGDEAPHLLTEEQRAGLVRAKERAAARVAHEAWLPKHLLYVKGWPEVEPTLDEAAGIAQMRREVADLLGVEVQYTTAETVLWRYRYLMAANADDDAGMRLARARLAHLGEVIS